MLPKTEQPDNRDHRPAILIVDDETVQRVRMESICEAVNADSAVQVQSTSTLRDAFAALSARAFHLVLLDKNLAGDTQTGISAISDILHLQPNVQILIVSGDDGVNDVASAMKAGAFWYVSKRNSDPLIRLQIEKALQFAKLMLDQKRVEHNAFMNTQGVTLAGSSEVTKRLLRQLVAVSQSDAPVLLLGETGCGKTNAARLIHNFRAHFLKQSGRPMIEVNLSAMSPTLIESELFGHEKGSFTNATERKQGLLELANGGTFFIDEVGELNNDMQVKLLKAIDGDPFYRVGGREKALHSYFKLVTATNRDLESMVRDGSFRADFFSRISTFVIKVPTLKERREDIPEILKSVYPKCAKKSRVNSTFEDLIPEVIAYLVENPPPENVRGLEKQLQRLITLSHKNKAGIPTFGNWRAILQYEKFVAAPTLERQSISANELMSLPIEVEADFPGFSALIDSISDRLIQSAKKKYGRNREVAKILKLSDGAVSMRLKNIKAQNGGTANAG